jgi:hypothetical protein
VIIAFVLVVVLAGIAGRRKEDDLQEW